MILAILAGVAVALAALPALLHLANLRLYRAPPLPTEPLPAVSVLIPARDEEAGIEAAVRAALASESVEVEVIVLDDHSTDRTAEIVRSIADPRVRLESSPALPEGWCGKQHACHVLAGLARHPLLLFQDADVRLAPQGAARLAGYLLSSNAALVSGIPHQQTGSFLERLLIPLIHFVLLGFLPLDRMRKSAHPAFAAGCGQLFLARAEAYRAAGGHAAIRATLHDGIKLPRAFRAAGLMSDLCDATELATCRMYHGAAQTWRGLGKNASEGLAAPGMIVPATLLLGGGQVMPFVLVPFAEGWALALTILACLLAYAPRLASMIRFKQSLLGALLHPLSVLLLLVVQWQAFFRSLVGGRSSWRGRTYPSS